MLPNALATYARYFERSNILNLTKVQLTTIGKRNGSGWVHRRPIAIVNEEIQVKNVDETKTRSVLRKSVLDDPERRPLKPKKQRRSIVKPAPVIVSDETYKSDGTLNISKFDEEDRQLSSLILEMKSKKTRERSGKILLEGTRLIQDALQACLVPEIILFSRKRDAEKIQLPKNGTKLYKVPYAQLQLWSTLTTSPGIMGIFKHPGALEKEPSPNALPLTIICDNVREPGNMGAILRVAAGAGCERIISMKGCVDIWESKVLRSAAGAHFRTSISNSVEWDELDTLLSSTANIFIADHDSMIVTDENEIDESSIAASDSERKRNDNDDESANGVLVESESEKNENVANEIANDTRNKNVFVERVTAKELSLRIPVIPYYSAAYAMNESILIVGGETEGLSFESIKLVQKRGGVRVNIPLSNDVESLNTGVALGIIAFEIKRQYAVHKISPSLQLRSTVDPVGVTV